MHNRHRRLVAVTAAAAGAVTIGFIGYGPASAGPNDGPRTLIASVPQTSILYRPCDNCVIASTPPGAHIGGTEIDSGTLRDSGGSVVGHYTLQAVGVTPFTLSKPGELNLHAVLVIGQDQIVADGIEEPPDNRGTAAIIGGTGRFAAAHGTITYTDQPDGSTDLELSVTGEN